MFDVSGLDRAPHCTAAIALVRNGSAEELEEVVAIRLRQELGIDDTERLLSTFGHDAGLFDVAPIMAHIAETVLSPRQTSSPAHLSIARSVACEVIARVGLSAAFGVDAPFSPLSFALNPHQRTLGYDGWGFKSSESGALHVVLVQVKGTEENRTPPQQAQVLASELVGIDFSDVRLTTALMRLLSLAQNHEQRRRAVLSLFAGIAARDASSHFVAGVLVRGTSDINDADVLDPGAHPAGFHILQLGIRVGQSLDAVGERSLARARAA